MDDFIQGLRHLAMKEGWLIESHDEEDGLRRLIVFRKEDGEVQRIATILVKDDKELLPEVAERIKDGLQERVEKELVDTSAKSLRAAVQALIDWLMAYLS